MVGQHVVAGQDVHSVCVWGGGKELRDFYKHLPRGMVMSRLPSFPRVLGRQYVAHVTSRLPNSAFIQEF